MGPKNIRGSPTSPFESKASRESNAIHQVTRAKVGELARNDSVVENGLKSKSHQNGTIVTLNFKPLDKPSPLIQPFPVAKRSKLNGASPPFVPNGKNNFGKKDSKGSDKDKVSVMAVSSCKVEEPSKALTVVQKAIPTGQSYTTRADYSMKDVIITSTSVTHNIVHLIEEQFPNGYKRYAPSREFSPGKYNFLERYNNMTSAEKRHFWDNNFVEIVVDIGVLDARALDAPAVGALSKTNTKMGVISKEGDKQTVSSKEQDNKEGTTIFDTMAKLGKEFVGYAKTVFVLLIFPQNGLKAPTTASYIPQSYGNNHRTRGPVTGAIDFDSTPSFAHIKDLVACLQKFISLEQLDITLQTPSSQPKPIEVSQLDHCLPFYELAFTGWRIWWKAPYMSQPHPVHGWTIGHLDYEWTKICMQREKEMMAIERAVFTHQSQFVPIRR